MLADHGAAPVVSCAVPPGTAATLDESRIVVNNDAVSDTAAAVDVDSATDVVSAALELVCAAPPANRTAPDPPAVRAAELLVAADPDD